MDALFGICTCAYGFNYVILDLSHLMKNSVAERIADFLGVYPPFNYLTHDELLRVAADVRVLSLEKNKMVFQINDALHAYFYVVASGVINLFTISDAEETLLNRCEPGDILGLRPFFAKNNYMMSAKAREESIIYAIPIDTFRPFALTNTDVLDFLLQSFASTARGTATAGKAKLLNDSVQLNDGNTEIQFFQSLDYNRSPMLVSPSNLVQQVAQQMTDNLTGCAVVQEKNMPIGLVTDADIRAKIATGRFSPSTEVRNIMSPNLVTVPENLSLAEAQLAMLRHNVSFLCVTIDGSERSPIRGVVSQHDLIAAQANNPGVLIKEIKRAATPSELKELREKLADFIRISIDNKIPLSHVSNIAGEVNIALIKRAIDLAILDFGSPPARFSWLSIGSQGRKEQLLLTDQDAFLVFEDVAPEKYKEVKEYFLRLAKRTDQILEEVGYAPSPDGIVAGNPLWCRSLSDWLQQYEEWMTNPGSKAESSYAIFFDYELAYGESSLEEAITEVIFRHTKNKKFLALLATEALKRPLPLSFFKNFVLEEDGPHKDLFDIKNRGLLIYADMARVLSLSLNIKGINNTFARFRQLAMTESKYTDAYQNAAEAFQTLQKFRALNGLRNGTNGQYLQIEELSKNDRERLKNCFLPLKDLEEILKHKFQLTYFS